MFLILLIFSGLAIISLGHALKRRRILQVLPTLGWLTFMVIPLLFSWNYFDLPEKKLQAIGVILVGLALLIGDNIFVFRSQGQIQNRLFLKTNAFTYVLWIIVIAIPLIHFYFTKQIPLFERFFGDYSKIEIAEYREEFNKFSIPYWFALLSNWSSSIFAPILIFVLAHKRNIKSMLFVVLWASVYALASNATSIIVVLISTIMIVYGLLFKNRLTKLISIFFVASCIFTITAGLIHADRLLDKAYLCNFPNNIPFSPANLNRACVGVDAVRINPIIDRIGYRVFLTPIEVSNHWYDYFNPTNNNSRSISEIVGRGTLGSTANKIGLEYYKKPFPNSYLNSVSAYASIDADAYSIGGFAFVGLSALMVFGLRILVGWDFIRTTLILRITQGIGLTQLFLLPASASMQALLIPQGMVILIVIILYLKWKLKAENLNSQ